MLVEGLEKILYLLGEVGQSKELVFFDLGLPVRRSDDRLDHIVVLGGDQPERNVNVTAGRCALIKQDVGCLTPVHNLKVFDLKAIPSKRTEGPGDHRYAVVHDDETVCVTRRCRVPNFIIDGRRVILPVADVLVEDAPKQLALVIANDRNELVEGDEPNVRFVYPGDFREQRAVGECEFAGNGVPCLAVELLNLFRSEAMKFHIAKYLHRLQVVLYGDPASL
jgi:hypothetical protein